jgi:hypothetical protein
VGLSSKGDNPVQAFVLRMDLLDGQGFGQKMNNPLKPA